MTHSWSAVLTTQGRRPQQLAAAVDSLFAQTDVALEVIVVGNGWVPRDLPDAVRAVHLADNLGAPEGRNHGVKIATGDFLFFLDDDAYLPRSDTLQRIGDLFFSHPKLGIVQTRIRTPEGDTLRRWVPRLHDKDPTHGSVVFSVLEGSVAVRAEVLTHSDGWAGPFFYAHEGIELAWRSWDAGFRVEYRPEFEAVHPRVELSRHHAHVWHNARNRVWLAKRNLPPAVAVLYVASWGGLTLIRKWRSPGDITAWLRGCWDGLRTPAGRSQRLSWRTIWTMSRHGRPPIV